MTPSVLKARSVQLKAVVISERVLGFDHPNTIQQYVSISIDVHHRLCSVPCGVITIAVMPYVLFLLSSRPFWVCTCLREGRLLWLRSVSSELVC